MPTIAELLTSYRDRTGASYGDMARKVRDELQISRLQQLATAPPKEFPKRARTIELLAELLEVPVATIVLAFAAGLGIPVEATQSRLAVLLPPNTDYLSDSDRDAIVDLARSLVEARLRVHRISSYGDQPIGFRPLTEAEQEEFGLAARRGPSEGRRAREQQDRDAEY